MIEDAYENKSVKQFLSTPPRAPDHDPVDHPSHYTAYRGLEVIDLVEQLNFNKGNAIKYIARAGIKDPDKEIEDLQKAAWYVNREIERLQKFNE